MTRTLDDSHDPSLRSWVESANQAGADFPIQNLPFGVFRERDAGDWRIGVAIGDRILDFRGASQLLGELPTELGAALLDSTLNALMALGHPAMRRLRDRLIALLRADSPHPDPSLLVAMRDAQLRVPMAIGDYT